MSSTFDDALGAFETAGLAPDTQDLPESTEPATPEADAPDVTESQPAEPDSKSIDISHLPEEAQIYLRAREREMQGDYTRKTQEVAQQRQEAEQYVQFVQALNSDPEFAGAVLERLQSQLQAAGYYQPTVEDEFGFDETGGYEDVESDPYAQELNEMREWRARVEREWEDTRNEAILNRQVAEIRSSHPEYSGDDIQDIYALGFFTNGDLHAANDMFRGMQDRVLARYLESKKSVQAPGSLPSSTGSAAPDSLKDADEKQLRAAALERLMSSIG